MTPLDTDAGRAVVDAMARVLYPHAPRGIEQAPQLREALLAALAVRTHEPCPNCGGKGRVVSQEGSYQAGAQLSVGCKTCAGSGTVPGVPALVELLMEPHGWTPKRGAKTVIPPAGSQFQNPYVPGDQLEHLYRVRSPLPGAAE